MAGGGAEIIAQFQLRYTMGANLKKWILAALALALFFTSKAKAAGAGFSVLQTRNKRNNNPGNLRKNTKDDWQGLDPQQNDSDYFRFISLYFGWRAMAITLLNYQHRYGLRTIAGIINRWAPPSENNTGAYTSYVAKEMGLDPNQQFDVRGRLNDLMLYMARQEGGTWDRQDPDRTKAANVALGVVI